MEWPKKHTAWIENRVLCVSIPFTWELPSVKADLQQRSMFWDRAVIGGPAVYLLPGYFDGMSFVKVRRSFDGVLQRVNPYATRTTTGCVRRCDYCGVPRFDGKFKELDDWPDLPIICDNNLFASTNKHFDKVIDRLKRHDYCDFNQGVDSRLLSRHHASRIAELKKPLVRLALDSMEYVDQWEKAFKKLRDAGLPKRSIRSYALIGFDSGIQEAWDRCEYILKKGIKPLPMWFHPLDALKQNIVTEDQAKLGWTEFERKLIMQYYYQRGKRRAMILENYGERLSKK